MTSEISKALSPDSPKTHSEISERARQLVVNHFNSRGRFTQLQDQSGISSAQWRNFYYGRQRVNEAMLGFVIQHFPDRKTWVLTGILSPDHVITPNSKHPYFPFNTPRPTEHDCATIGQRLSWVIRQRVSDKGAKLFQHLSKVSNLHGKEIGLDDWANVLLGLNEPTLDMVSVICSWNREFTLWIIHGPYRIDEQVDPSDTDSVANWTDYLAHREFLAEVEGGIPSSRPSTKSSPTKDASQVRKHGNKKG